MNISGCFFFFSSAGAAAAIKQESLRVNQAAVRDHDGANERKLAAMFMPGIITQKCLASAAGPRAAMACEAAFTSCWRRLQASRRKKEKKKKKLSPYSVDI